MNQTICSRRQCGGLLLVVFLTCALSAGCGKPKGTVFGKVTYLGKPLTTGFVTFTPEKGAAVHSRIDSEGKYRVENVPVGPVKISIRPEGAPSEESQNQAPPKPRSPAEMKKFLMPEPSKGPMIPPKYKDPNNSGLTYTVEQGPQEHDIPLQ